MIFDLRYIIEQIIRKVASLAIRRTTVIHRTRRNIGQIPKVYLAIKAVTIPCGIEGSERKGMKHLQGTF